MISISLLNVLPRGAGTSLPALYARHNICTEVISISLSHSPALAYEGVCSTCRMWGHESLFAGFQLDLLIFSRYQNDIVGCPSSSFHAHFTFMIFGYGWLWMAGQWSCACEWGGWGAPHWGGEDWAIWGHEARCCIFPCEIFNWRMKKFHLFLFSTMLLCILDTSSTWSLV